MLVSRRGFLSAARDAAGALGWSALHLSSLSRLLANPNAPTVLWLQGASCSGCSVSFLNYISGTAPKTAADVLISVVNLAFHPTVMTAEGELAVSAVNSALAKGNYILVVEGGIPTAFNGHTCEVWKENGVSVTMKDAVTKLAAKAYKLISIGTCASYGGVPRAGSNPTGIRTLKEISLKQPIHIPGCPPHPNWIISGIVNAIQNTVGTVDTAGRPTSIYGTTTIHSVCPRRERSEASTYGRDNTCLEELGCKGPSTRSKCSTLKWNNGQNWCVDANSQCIGCVNTSFPGTGALRRQWGTGD